MPTPSNIEERVDQLHAKVDMLTGSLADEVRKTRVEVGQILEVLRGRMDQPESGVFARLTDAERRLDDIEAARRTFVRAVGGIAITAIGAAAIAIGAWVWQAVVTSASHQLTHPTQPPAGATP